MREVIKTFHFLENHVPNFNLNSFFSLQSKSNGWSPRNKSLQNKNSSFYQRVDFIFFQNGYLDLKFLFLVFPKRSLRNLSQFCGVEILGIFLSILVASFCLILRVKKTSPLLQRGSLPPSPNISFWGYPPPSPSGETSFMDGP